MAQITLKGNPVNTSGTIPQIGDTISNFKLTSNGMEDRSLENYSGKKLILNIFPSIDTGTCAASVRRFNQEAAAMSNTVVLNISKDLPFAQKRFCAAEGIENVETLSEFKDSNFSNDYRVGILDGPLSGLMSRAVVIANENGKVIHSEQVGEIVDEPNYEAALNALK